MAAGADLFDSPAIKILLIGDTSVGKSCLLVRFTEGTFDDGTLATIGIDFRARIVTVDGEPTKLQIWDTAGQEKFRVISRAYYRGAHGIMVVFDVTARETFKQVESWIDAIHNNVQGDVAVLLVGNKCDLDSERVVTTDEATAVAGSLAIPYLETSAKKNIGVEDAFLRLASLASRIARPGGPDKSSPKVNVVELQNEKVRKRKGGCC